MKCSRNYPYVQPLLIKFVSFICTTTTIEGAQKFDGRGKMEELRDNEYANSNSVKYKHLKSRPETHLKEILENKYEQN